MFKLSYNGGSITLRLSILLIKMSCPILKFSNACLIGWAVTYWWWYKGLRVWLGVAFGQYLHFFCFSLYCYVTCLCSLCQLVMVSCLRLKIYGFPWRLLLFFCLHLANLSCYFSTLKCNPSWYFDDVKSIILSLRSAPNQTLSPLYHQQEA